MLTRVKSGLKQVKIKTLCGLVAALMGAITVASAATLTVTDDNGKQAPVELQSNDYLRLTATPDGDMFLEIRGFATLDDGSGATSGDGGSTGADGSGTGGDGGSSGGDGGSTGGDVGSTGGDGGSTGGDGGSTVVTRYTGGDGGAQAATAVARRRPDR